MLPIPQQAWWQQFQQQEAANRQAVLQRMAQLSPQNAHPWGQFANPLFQRTAVPVLAQGNPQAAMFGLLGAQNPQGQVDPHVWQLLMGGAGGQ